MENFENFSREQVTRREAPSVQGPAQHTGRMPGMVGPPFTPCDSGGGEPDVWLRGMFH